MSSPGFFGRLSHGVLFDGGGGRCGKGGKRGRGGVKQTFPKHLAKLLPDRHQQHLDPKVPAHGLGDTEGPRAAFDVARVLPHGPHAALEEVHRVLHLDVLEGEAVDAFPEGFYGRDILQHGGEAVFVAVQGGGGGGCGCGIGGGGGRGGEVLFVVEGPGVA